MWNSTNVSSSGQPSSPLPYSKYEPFFKESHSKWILSVIDKIYFNDFYANFKNKGYALTVFSLFWVFFVVNCKRRWRNRSRCSENCFVEAKAIYGQFGTILTAAKKFSVFCSFLVFFCPDYNLLIICEERVLFWIWISQKDEIRNYFFLKVQTLEPELKIKNFDFCFSDLVLNF